MKWITEYKRITTGLPWWNPIGLVATCFGIGRIRYLSTSLASLLAYVIVVALSVRPDFYTATAGVTCVLFFVGWFAANFYIRETGIEHPHDVVIDELVGQLVGILVFYYSCTILISFKPSYRDSYFLQNYYIPSIALFLLFRFYDVAKPHWLRWVDANVKGGFGIMIDDVVAGIYAAMTLHSFIFSELIFRHIQNLRTGG